MAAVGEEQRLAVHREPVLQFVERTLMVAVVITPNKMVITIMALLRQNWTDSGSSGDH